MIRNFILVAIALALCSFAPAFQSGDPFKPGKLQPAEVAALQPGLTLRFYARADDAKALDARRVRLAALHIPAGTSPSPFIAAGPVHAKLLGYLKNPLKGSYTFRLTGTGTMTLRINDKDVLKKPGQTAEVELAKNYNKIDIIYASPSKGDSTVRLDWSGEKFGFEPVPADMLFSRKDDADLEAQTLVREGRQLYADRHCASCHAVPGKLLLKDCVMPEMQSKAPSLDGGARFQHDWLVAWILDPRSLRPDATMPRVLTGPDAEQRAADIAAYVRFRRLVMERGGPEITFRPSAELIGMDLFKKYGCNTCHRLDDPKNTDELGRLSLYHVAAKFSNDDNNYWLRAFLLEPHKRYSWTRMPDFRLKDHEERALAAYLVQEAKGKINAKPKGDVVRGAGLFEKEGCINCHQVEGPTKKTTAMSIQSLEKGCLADKHNGKAPDFGLTASERAALTAFLKTDGKSLTRETPAEFSLRQVKSLRCDSCHRRDGEITRWHAVLEDEGKNPENLPSLTWAGEKLQPAWTKKLFAGDADSRARPWLKARMPAFPARADMMAVGLSHEHGFAIDEDQRPAPDAKLAAIGEKLIPQQGGFKCNDCHGIGKQPAIQPFEAPGINLRDAAVRLRYNYYQRWMLAPDRVDVTMRMPIFATDGKTTQIREVFDGDARRQFDALWHYIQTLPAKK